MANPVYKKQYDDGMIVYFKDAEMAIIHREDGPAVEHSDGSKFWIQNRLLHRENGPAVEYPCGSKYWYKHGIKHREDGPANEVHRNGKVYKDYWVDGKKLSFLKFLLFKLSKSWKEFKEDLRKSKENPKFDKYYLENLGLYINVDKLNSKDYKCKKSLWKK
jgi:hypothetical protein